jgi:hypothetical protein
MGDRQRANEIRRMWLGTSTDQLIWKMGAVDENYRTVGHLWGEYQVYQRAARTQIGRVTDALWEHGRLDAMHLDPINDRSECTRMSHLLNQAIVETHFFLSCWSVIARHLIEITAMVGDSDLKEMVDSQSIRKADREEKIDPDTKKAAWESIERDAIGWYIVGRNWLEHYEERVVGRRGKDDTRLTGPQPDGFHTLSMGPDGVFLHPSITLEGQLQIGDYTWAITFHQHNRHMMFLAECEELLRDIMIPQIEGHDEETRRRERNANHGGAR